jgi:hypothetical protein
MFEYIVIHGLQEADISIVIKHYGHCPDDPVIYVHCCHRVARSLSSGTDGISKLTIGARIVDTNDVFKCGGRGNAKGTGPYIIWTCPLCIVKTGRILKLSVFERRRFGV